MSMPIKATIAPSNFVFTLSDNLDHDMGTERAWILEDVAVRLNVPRTDGTFFSPKLDSLADQCRKDDASLGCPNNPCILGWNPRSLGQWNAEAMLREQHKIPSGWRKYDLFFMKTEWWDPEDASKNRKGIEYVPFLHWANTEERWILDFYCLKNFNNPDNLLAGETALKFNKNAMSIIQ